MKAEYLLPCSCGKKVPVDAGQAGAKVACSCGQQLTVPTFRALRDLERVTPTTAVLEGTPWSTARGILFSVGTLVSVIAAVLVLYHLFMYSQLLDGGEAWKQEHLNEMRVGVDYLTPVEAIADFQDMASKGLTVDGVPPWTQISAVRDSSRRWLMASLVALAFGLVSLTASLLGAKRSKVK
ncbi:MAG: hypothetical protein IAF94_13460 [Pirellulaceae bacterium]|nr:hypothetical protein [Pirellulaceae bacterium]